MRPESPAANFACTLFQAKGSSASYAFEPKREAVLRYALKPQPQSAQWYFRFRVKKILRCSKRPGDFRAGRRRDLQVGHVGRDLSSTDLAALAPMALPTGSLCPCSLSHSDTIRLSSPPAAFLKIAVTSMRTCLFDSDGGLIATASVPERVSDPMAGS